MITEKSNFILVIGKNNISRFIDIKNNRVLYVKNIVLLEDFSFQVFTLEDFTYTVKIEDIYIIR